RPRPAWAADAGAGVGGSVTASPADDDVSHRGVRRGRRQAGRRARVRLRASEHARAPGARRARHARFRRSARERRDDRAFRAERVEFPCVLRPLALSASRGVIRANDAREFVAAFRRIAAILESVEAPLPDEARQALLVEEFIPGREVALEGLLIGGTLHVLAIFDKPDPLDGPFFEETIYVTPSRLAEPVQAAIAAVTRDACAALGLTEGPIH